VTLRLILQRLACELDRLSETNQKLFVKVQPPIAPSHPPPPPPPPPPHKMRLNFALS
jgi:hypothetical protein